MGQLLEIANGIATNPLRGVMVLLVFLLGLAIWAYWQERKRNNTIQDERVAEAREDTELMTKALVEASMTVKEFKGSNDALRLAFEALRIQRQ